MAPRNLQSDADKLAYQINQTNEITMICLAVMRALGIPGPIRMMVAQAEELGAELARLRKMERNVVRAVG